MVLINLKLHVHIESIDSLILVHLISPAGGDYTPLTTDLTFGGAAVTKVVTIVIHDDLVVEDSEFFNMTLTTTDPSVTLEPAAAAVTIEDEDSKLLHIYSHACNIVKQNDVFSPYSGITIGFYCNCHPRYYVNENAGSINVTVQIPRGSPAREVIVTLQTVDGSAVGKAFYLAIESIKNATRCWASTRYIAKLGRDDSIN